MGENEKGVTGKNKVMTVLSQGKKLSIPTRMMIVLIRIYQNFLSPFLGSHCRFQPTCSNYFIEAISGRGFIRGTGMGLKRIVKCHPFHKGGYDPVGSQEMPLKRKTANYDATSEVTNPSDRTKDHL